MKTKQKGTLVIVNTAQFIRALESLQEENKQKEVFKRWWDIKQRLALKKQSTLRG